MQKMTKMLGPVSGFLVLDGVAVGFLWFLGGSQSQGAAGTFRLFKHWIWQKVEF